MVHRGHVLVVVEFLAVVAAWNLDDAGEKVGITLVQASASLLTKEVDVPKIRTLTNSAVLAAWEQPAKQPVFNTNEGPVQPLNTMEGSGVEQLGFDSSLDIPRILALEHSELPVDLVPDISRLQHRSSFMEEVFKPQRPTPIFRYISFFKNAYEHLGPGKKHHKPVLSEASDETSGETVDETAVKASDEILEDLAPASSSQLWIFAFVCNLIVMGFVVWRGCESYRPVCMKDEVLRRRGTMDQDLLVARGRPCWTPFCFAIVTVLCFLVFWATVVTIHMVNEKTALHPEMMHNEDGSYVVVRRYPITQPAKGGFLAGEGVALSAAVASVFISIWRFNGQVPITTSLLSRFILRGATLSLCVAILLEIGGEAVLKANGRNTAVGPTFGNALMMLVVGASEETAKLLVVVIGVYLSAEAYRQASSSHQSMCVLVESRRALMLAGFAVGFGFMINENAEYIMAAAATPPMGYLDSKGNVYDMVGEGALMATTILTIIVRVFLNIHPWWAGLSSARVAGIVFQEGRSMAMPGLGEFLWAILPSMLLHAMYDFVVSSGATTLIALITPFAFFFGSRWLFMRAWEQAGADDACCQYARTNKQAEHEDVGAK